MLCLEAHRAHREWLRSRASDDEVARWYIDKPWNNPRLSEAEYYRLRYQLDPEFNASERARIAERKNCNVDYLCTLMRDTLVRGGRSPTIEMEMGFTIDELRVHLERQFTDGMNWEAFNRGEIHIDHITPKAAFDMTKPSQRRECWRLDNLQPLWARDNILKAASV